MGTLKASDLVVDKYYCMIHDSIHFYFKFKFLTDGSIFSDNFHIEHINDEFVYVETSVMKFCFISWFEISKFTYEIDIGLIINYLPDTYPDKKFYIRKNKINFLLKN